MKSIAKELIKQEKSIKPKGEEEWTLGQERAFTLGQIDQHRATCEAILKEIGYFKDYIKDPIVEKDFMRFIKWLENEIAISKGEK